MQFFFTTSCRSYVTWLLAGVFCILLVPLFVAFAQFNPEINYQAKLTDTAGVAVTNGDYDIVFRLYTASSTGTAIWTESRTGADQVTVTNGLFSVMLGDVNSLSAVDFNQTLYLGVTVGADSEMAPRKVLGTVPAAFVSESANTVGGVASSSFLRSDQADTMAASTTSSLLTINQMGAGNILDLLDDGTSVFTVADGGNVGIGTSTPASRLTITDSFVFTGSELITNGTFATNATGWALQTDCTYWSGGALVFLLDSNCQNGAYFVNANTTVSLTTGVEYRLSFEVVSTTNGEVAGVNFNNNNVSYVAGEGVHTITFTSEITGTETINFESNSYILDGGFVLDNVSLRAVESAQPVMALFDKSGNPLMRLGDNSFSASTFGIRAGIGNTGIAQSAFGASAGYGNLGRAQSAFGASAGYGNSGNDQSVLGTFAGYRNVVEGQSAVGGYSGYFNTGINQSAFGRSAGYLNIGGSQSAFGVNSGYENTGINQSAFGLAAGYLNTGASQSAFGYNSGYQNSGDLVSSFGYEAGRGNSGNNLVAIGYQAGLNNSLANQFIVQQANINAIPLLQGDFASGNIGIGTTTLGSKLTVAGDAYITGALRDSSNSAGTTGYVLQTTGSGTQWVATSSLGIGGGSSVTFGTDNQLPFMNSGGSDFEYSDNLTFDGTNLNLGANLGLAINGVRMFTASTTLNNISIGQNAGVSYIGGISSANEFNLTLGFEAGRLSSSTSSFSNGYNNLIGYRAGQANTGSENNILGSEAGNTNTGSNNNIFGYQAGFNNTGFTNNILGRLSGYNNTGSDNNILGDEAGYDNTGSDNNLFGLFAGYFNTGSSNNILGEEAGYANTGSSNNILGVFAGDDNSGSNNNLFGRSAGANNTGSDNNLFGRSAGANNTGSDNNSFGRFAGFGNTGSFSTFIGYEAAGRMSASNTIAIGRETLRGGSGLAALGPLGTTTNNTAIGAFAGYSAQTGADNNLLLGYRSGYSLTTGANNIIIGYDVDAPSNTGSNQLNIGNLIFGTGIDGTGTTLSTGNIGIGTSTSSSRLTVAGDAYITGVLRDSSNSAGTNGYILQTTGTGTQWVATSSLGIGGGSSVTFGTDNQLPFMNSGGNDFEYSSGLTFDGSNLNLGGVNTGLAFQGTRMFYASTTNDSIAIGEGAGLGFTSLTTNNIAIGFDAGRNATSSSAVRNNYIGFEAGLNNSGRNNNIFGYYAGRFNSGGDNNMFGVLAGNNNSGWDNNMFGEYAGTVNTGDDNNIMGYFAGYTNSGFDNNILGRDAGYNNTGNENNLFGWRSGRNNTGFGNNLIAPFAGFNNTGNYVNAIGPAAGYNNSGSYVNLIGENAGRSNTGSYTDYVGYRAGVIMSASNTVAIGRESLRGGSGDPFGGNAATTTNNTALGAFAGYSAQTGADNNLLLGYRSGYSLTTGANNIIIGYDVEAPSNTGSNQLNIGNLIFGTGVDGTGTTLSTGNIGIGTTSPSTKLDVWGGLRVGTSSPIIFADSSTNQVGINTSTPNNQLTVLGNFDVVNSSNEGYRFRTSSTWLDFDAAADPLVTSVYSGTGFTGTQNIYSIFDDSAHQAVAYGNWDFRSGNEASFTGGDSILMIDRDVQRVGIGTTTPGSKLTVAGDAYITGALRDSTNSAGTTGYVLQTTGTGTQWVATSSLGIGGGSSVTFGTDNQIPLMNSGGTDFEYSSGLTYDGTNLNLGGTNGIALGGTRVLTASTTLANYVFGENAGAAITTATNNIAIGAFSLAAIATSRDNVAIGTFTGAELTTGRSLVAIGESAARNTTTGIESVVIGAGAGFSFTSASANTVIGAGAFGEGFSGGNVAMGWRAGRGSTTEATPFYSNGVYIGNSTGENLESGANNGVFLGYQAGLNVSTGANNLLLGYQAADSLTTGANNIIIGYDVEAPSNTASNQLNVGNLIFGTGIDGIGTTLSSGNIGIGTTSPSSKLTVAGDAYITGALRDSSNSAGTNGYVLQTTGTGTQWVATSSLGIGGGSSVTFGTDNQLPFMNSGGTDFEYASTLTYNGTDLNLGGNNGISLGGTRVFFASTTRSFVAVGGGAGQSAGGAGMLGNSYFGDYAGGAHASGVYNTFLGNSAGAGATTTNNSVFIGSAAGFGLDGSYSADGLVLIGDAAGIRLRTGASGNVMIGRQAGDFVSTGSRNTLLGADVAGNLTTGSRNIIIGADIDAVSATVANSLNIGNLLFGTGIDGTGTTLSTGNIGIGTTSPSARLTVAGDSLTTGRILAGATADLDGVVNLTGAAGMTTDGIIAIEDTFSDFSFDRVSAIGSVMDINPDANYALAGIDGISSVVQTRLGNSFNLGQVTGITSSVGHLGSGTVTEMIGQYIEVLNPAAGTITNTYGLLIGDVVGGNQTNTAYSIYAQDPDAWNYFAGNVGIGTDSPDSLLDMSSIAPVIYLTDTDNAGGSDVHNGGLSWRTGFNSTYAFLGFSNDRRLRISNSATGANSNIQLSTEDDITFDTAGSERFRIDANGNIGIGTTTPNSKLSLENLTLDGAGVSGIDQYLVTTNSVDAAVQFGNRSYMSASNTATTTLVGNMYRINDSTTFGNTIRGLEVQADRGTNTQGENTALSGFARTFGVRGFSSGDAGGSFEPAGGFFETGGTTQGNAIRGYSSSITTAALLSLFQDTSSFTGTGLEMNFGNTTGDFSSTSSKYLDFQNAGTSIFTVSAFGTTTIGDGTTNNLAGLQIGNGGLCVDNDGACNASVAGRIASVSTFAGNSDLAEIYFSSQALKTGEVVTLAGELSVNRAEQANQLPILGVVSTKPGLLLGADDTSTRPGEDSYPIALSGRVPVYLSTENGPITKGDRLMLSSIPGVAMKATSTGTTIGIALEDFDESRYYSTTYLNQFGDDLVNPVVEPILTNTDARINDGCYYSGGTAAGEAPCVPLTATTSAGQIAEANQIAAQQSVDAQLVELAAVGADTRTTPAGESVKVGQVVMFVQLEQRWIDDAQLATLQSLLSTSTITEVGENAQETLFDRLVALANSFVDGIFTAIGIEVQFVKTNEVQSDTLCLGSTCIDEAELRALLAQPAPASDSSNGESQPSNDDTDPVETDTTPTEPPEPTGTSSTTSSSTPPAPPVTDAETDTATSSGDTGQTADEDISPPDTTPTESLEPPSEPEPAADEPPPEPPPEEDTSEAEQDTTATPEQN